MTIRGLESRKAIIGAAISTIIGSIPPAMEGEIYGAQFANLTSSSVAVEIFQRRVGTVTGVVEAVALGPFTTERKGFGGHIIGKIYSEHELCGTATAGSVEVVLLYRYVPGRTRIP